MSGKDFEELKGLVVEWGEDKGILDKSNPLKQLEKTEEEFNELRAATGIDDQIGMVDGVGDVVVTLILFCELANLDFKGCLEYAYDEIKGRQGKMVDGIFVKYE